MTAPELQAQVNAAHRYEALFVPALFGQWAALLADTARIRHGQRVLDVACGTGIVARTVFDRDVVEFHATGATRQRGRESRSQQQGLLHS